VPTLPDISGLIAGFQTLATNLVTLIIAFATLTGVTFIVGAGVALFKASRDRDGPSWSAIGGSLLIGTMLLQFVRSANNTTLVATGSNITPYSSAMSYIPIASQSSFWQSVLLACLAWVVTMGWAGFFKGLLLWKASTNGKSSRGDEISRGFTHVIGGALAINIGLVLQSAFS
jgi:hypothetical protein